MILSIEIRHAAHPEAVKHYDTEQLRREFLIEDLFQPGKVKMVYSHYDRVVVGGAVPVREPIRMEPVEELRTDTFFERREAGFVLIGGGGAVITVDKEDFELKKRDALYVGKGAKEVYLRSLDTEQPARIYFVSTLAHQSYPTVKVGPEDVEPLRLGSPETSNKRSLYQYIHADGVQSCQLMMGVTVLEDNSVWNTMPAHLHDRRMEVYLYFDFDEDARVFHFMGQPQETRHLVVKNEQGVISPSWSIHSGAGMSSYTFVWAMAGENYTFKDMDSVNMDDLK